VSNGANGQDLVLLSLPGVQVFISESRTTSDLVSSSRLMSGLADCAVAALRTGDVDIVMPAAAAAAESESASVDQSDRPAHGEGGGAGTPNRIVVLAPAGSGAVAAARAAEAVREQWQSWLSAVYPTDSTSTRQMSATPGFPDVQWVCVGPEVGGYAQQFATAQVALAARRRIRTFTPVLEERQRLCSVSARWVAAPPPTAGRRASRRHERDEVLSAVNWVKRVAPHLPERPKVPSTISIATAPYRAVVAEKARADVAVRAALLALHAVGQPVARPETPIVGLPLPEGHADLDRAIAWLSTAGGPWVHADHWSAATVEAALVEIADDPATSGAKTTAAATPATDLKPGTRAAIGREAAKALAKELKCEPGKHFAVIVQDLDDMGRYLSGAFGTAPTEVTASWHQQVSAQLAAIAEGQQEVLTAGDSPLYAVPVYAGGDDLLLLAPAATALRLANQVRGTIPDDLRPASTAVYYAHHRSGLQAAVRAAGELLHEAKSARGKNALGIGFERRSGGRYDVVTPWRSVAGGLAATELIEALGGTAEGDSGTAEGDSGAAPTSAGHGVSPRLVTDLERDREELGSLLAPQEPYRATLTAELARLVARHCGRTNPVGADRRLAAVLVTAGQEQARRPGAEVSGFDPVPAARVAVFLRQEAR
jgi:CRISPR-associated protein Cmr2